MHWRANRHAASAAGASYYVAARCASVLVAVPNTYSLGSSISMMSWEYISTRRSPGCTLQLKRVRFCHVGPTNSNKCWGLQAGLYDASNWSGAVHADHLIHRSRDCVRKGFEIVKAHLDRQMTSRLDRTVQTMKLLVMTPMKQNTGPKHRSSVQRRKERELHRTASAV